MLFSIDDPKHPIREIPHKKDFDACRARLTDEEFAAILAVLDSRIQGTEVQTSCWMPGNDWSGTPFWPVFDKACRRNRDASGLFFGQLVWKVFMDRPEDWSFGRYEKKGIPIRGVTYFRINR